MDNELDLRQYAVTILRRWPLILAVTLIVTLVASLISVLRPPSYRATATIEAAYPRYTWRFDTAMQSVVDTRKDPRDTIISLAKTPDVLETLSAALGGSPSPESLQHMGSTRRGTGYLLYLDVEAANPQQAAKIANRWAELLIAMADPSSQDLELLTQELQTAEEELAAVEAQLEAFRTETGQLGMGTQLAVGGKEDVLFASMTLDQQRLVLKNSVLAEHQHALDQLHLVMEAAEHSSDVAALPLQLLSVPVLEARERVTPQALAELDDLNEVLARLQAEEAALGGIVDELRADASQLQAQLAQEEAELDRLLRQRSLILERTNRLERKIDELETQQRFDDSGVRIVGKAKAPNAPAGTSLPLTIIAALVVGLVAGVLIALAWEFLSRLSSVKTEPEA